MNNSTIVPLSPYDALVPSSIKALKDSFAANVGFIVLGLLVATSNILELLTIVKDKKLRTRCYFLIANFSVAAIFNSVSFMATAIKRFVRLYFLIPEVNTKRNCAAEMFGNSFGQTGIIYLPLATALDRICAAWMPIRYKNMSSKYAVMLACIAWLMALTDTCFSFYGNDQNNLVANCNLVSATEVLYQVQTTIELVITVWITVCYVAVLTLLRKQMKSTAATSERFAAVKMKLQIKVAKTLSIDSAVHLLTQTASRVGLVLLTPLSPEVRFQYGPFIRLFVMAGSGVSLIIFLLVNNEFKMAFHRTFPCFGYKIAPGEMTMFTRMSTNQIAPDKLKITNVD